MRVLITGVSTRAAAESAARAGFAVTAVDAFADLDQHPGVEALTPPRSAGARLTPRAMARAACALQSDAVAYLSPFENHPRLVAALARGRVLWGNPPDTLRRVRDPGLVADALRRRGLAAAGVLNDPPSPLRGFGAASPNDPNDFLLKPLDSGGGHRVRPWRAGSPVPRGYYLQQRIQGIPGSVVFVAAGGRAMRVGISRQIVGDAAFGASGYRYCGSLLAPPDAADAGRSLARGAVALADAVAAEFGLVGVNGIDFIACEGVPVAIEVNPRWPASIELVERALGRPLFGAHVDACRRGGLPAGLDGEPGTSGTFGKAIVFARTDMVAGDTRRWLDDPDVRDVPRQGERIPAGAPVCTVFARAATEAECYRGLVERAEQVYHALARWSG